MIKRTLLLFLVFTTFLTHAQSIEESLEWLNQKNIDSGFSIKALKSTSGLCFNSEGTGTVIFNEDGIFAQCEDNQLKKNIIWKSIYKIDITSLNEITLISSDFITLIIFFPDDQIKSDDLQLVQKNLQRIVKLNGGKLVNY